MLLLCPSYSCVFFCAQEPMFSWLCSELYEGFVCIYFSCSWPLIWLCSTECNSGQVWWEELVDKEGRGPCVACGRACCVSTFERGDADSTHWYLSGHEHVWPLLLFGGMPCGREESTQRVALFISIPPRLGWKDDAWHAERITREIVGLLCFILPACAFFCSHCFFFLAFVCLFLVLF